MNKKKNAHVTSVPSYLNFDRLYGFGTGKKLLNHASAKRGLIRLRDASYHTSHHIAMCFHEINFISLTTEFRGTLVFLV